MQILDVLCIIFCPQNSAWHIWYLWNLWELEFKTKVSGFEPNLAAQHELVMNGSPVCLWGFCTDFKLRTKPSSMSLRRQMQHMTLDADDWHSQRKEEYLNKIHLKITKPKQSQPDNQPDSLPGCVVFVTGRRTCGLINKRICLYWLMIEVRLTLSGSNKSLLKVVSSNVKHLSYW